MMKVWRHIGKGNHAKSEELLKKALDLFKGIKYNWGLGHTATERSYKRIKVAFVDIMSNDVGWKLAKLLP